MAMSIYNISWTRLLSQPPVKTKLTQLFNKRCMTSGFKLKSINSDQNQLLSNSSTRLWKVKLHFVPLVVSRATIYFGQDQRRTIAADTKTTAVTIWEDLKQIRFSPIPALALGFSGLIPFVSAPVYMILTQTVYSQLIFAQTVYGACILSFLGGVRWGFVIPEGSEHPANWFNLGYSVVPSLVAWVALLLPQPLSILGVMGGIAGTAYFDTAVKGYPPWFKGLRFTLSLGAVLSLWTVFLCQYILSGPAEKQVSDSKAENKIDANA